MSMVRRVLDAFVRGNGPFLSVFDPADFFFLLAVVPRFGETQEKREIFEAQLMSSVRVQYHSGDCDSHLGYPRWLRPLL